MRPRSPFSPAALCLVLIGVFGCVDPPPGVDLRTGAVVDSCEAASDGALCDDNNVCTISDVCVSGVCTGDVAPEGSLCTDGNVCTRSDSCRSGICTGDPLPDNTACTDGDPCTLGDVCRTGRCVAGTTLLTCNDSIACTMDTCLTGVGCRFTPAGDCASLDASPDVTDALAPPDVSTAGDGAPADGQVTESGVSDGPADVAGPDLGAEVASDRPAAVDATDGAGDLPPAGDGGGDARADAVADGGGDARDAGGTMLRARGGACSCAAAGGPAGAAWSSLAAAAVALTLCRRRGRRMCGRRGRRRLG